MTVVYKSAGGFGADRRANRQIYHVFMGTHHDAESQCDLMRSTSPSFTRETAQSSIHSSFMRETMQRPIHSTFTRETLQTSTGRTWPG